MKGFVPLLKKELLEQIRTYRLVIVCGVFLLFGISTPLMYNYMPQILEFAGEGFVIEFPQPTAVQVLAEYSATIAQVGLLVAVLVAMGGIANELRRGTAVMTLSKPVGRGTFISAKFAAMSLTFAASLAVASLVCFAYTAWIIESADIGNFLLLTLLLGIFLVFCLAVTLLFSSIFKSSLAAGGISIAILIGQAIIGAVPIVGDYMPGKLLNWGTSLLTDSGDAYWGALGVTIAAMIMCYFLARYVLNTRDL